MAGMYLTAIGGGFIGAERFITQMVLVWFGVVFGFHSLNIGVVYFVHRPKLQWWCRTISVLSYVFIDILCSHMVMYSEVNGLSRQESEFQFIPGAFVALLNIVVISPLMNTPGKFFSPGLFFLSTQETK